MSSTEIFGFDKDGNAYIFAEVRNAWHGAMAVWGIMEERYLPPYVPEHVKYCNWYKPDMPYDELVALNGYKPTRTISIMDDNAMKEIWALFKSDEVSETDKIVLGTTFDHVVVRRANIPKVIEAFNAFEGETSLKEQAAVLQLLLEDENCIAIAWNQTSVCSDPWSSAGGFDEEKGEYKPYNLNKQDEHWFLFADDEDEAPPPDDTKDADGSAKRKVCVFDDFAYACQYFNSNTDVNNGYGCDHPKQEESDPDSSGKEQGKCFCSSCPLGIEPDEEDWNNPDVDFDGLQLGDFLNLDGKWPEGGDGEHIMIYIEPDASDDEKRALYNYERRLNRYNKEWDGGTWKHFHKK